MTMNQNREQSGKNKRMKDLPAPTPSAQFDMFTAFYGDPKKHSNTIELWDAIPKYSCSARKQIALRDKDGRLPIWEREFIYKPDNSDEQIPATMQIKPALIKVDGTERSFLPSVNEELIEEVLRKLFADQKHGRHYADQEQSFVEFSLAMIARELRMRGHSRSLEQIKLSLMIMNECRLLLFFHGNNKKAAYRGAIIPEAIEVSRAEYLADPKSRWRVTLPFVYSRAINNLQFRQFNYEILMSMSSQLARWLHKLLARRYTNASLTQPYSIRYSTIKRDSALLVHSREDRNRETVRDALEELRAQDVLLFYKVSKSAADGRDPLYELTPTGVFVAEVKAANKRQLDYESRLLEGNRPAPFAAGSLPE